MAFSTRKITARLVDGKIVFWPGEVNSGNQSKGTVVCLLEGDFASSSLLPLNLDEATPLRISLLDQIAFHVF